MADWHVNVRNAILDHITGGTAYTQPSVFYLALGDDIASEVLTGEMSGDGYARQQISATNMAAAASGLSTNDVVITFGPATADWNGGAAVTHFSIITHATDAAAAGNTILAKTLTAGRIILDGDSAEFAIGALDITLTT